MALIRRSELRGGETFIAKSGLFKSAERILLDEAKEYSESKTYDIFLSHSVLDANEIYMLKRMIESMGYSVYVDWMEDPQLDRSKVTPKTAIILRQRMNRCRSLFFATSSNSVDSKWMPWELGYFDGKIGKSAILPVYEYDSSTNVYKGQEYLGLYPYVTKDKPKDQSYETLWIGTDENTYVMFSKWLLGNQPTSH
jgi:hypothetical protein